MLIDRLEKGILNADFEHPTRKGLFMEIQKIIHKHLWLIDGHKYKLSIKY